MIRIMKEGKEITSYELECTACGTVFRFHDVDIEYNFIRCPACGWFTLAKEAHVVEEK